MTIASRVQTPASDRVKIGREGVENASILRVLRVVAIDRGSGRIVLVSGPVAAGGLSLNLARFAFTRNERDRMLLVARRESGLKRLERGNRDT